MNLTQLFEIIAMHSKFTIQELLNINEESISASLSEVGYVKFVGYYSSWDSSYYTKCYQVKPVTQVTSSFERI